MDDINMIRNKKIVFCIDSLEKGGAERVVSVLANNLSIENNVYIMTIDKEKIQYKLNDNISLIEIEKKYNLSKSTIRRQFEVLLFRALVCWQQHYFSRGVRRILSCCFRQLHW